MEEKRLHKFYLSYKIDREVITAWVEGMNLRHAKEKLELMYPEASDIMDWTYESKEDLQAYIDKCHKNNLKFIGQQPKD